MSKRSLKQLRPLLLVGIVTFIIAQIVALSPSSVEEAESPAASEIPPEVLVVDTEKSLATGIPKGRIPEDIVDQFNYVSSQGAEKQWNLVADQALFYRPERLVHAKKVRALLYDPDGKTTVITGQEAKYFMTQSKDLEVFGTVKTVFPDGFEVNSEYLRYKPQLRQIEIPKTYYVTGQGLVENGKHMRFESYGFDYAMAKSEIILPQDVHITFQKPGKKPAPDDPTDVQADHCVIYRNKQMAHFTMFTSRPLKERFVHITQPRLFARSRRADFNYGDNSQILQYLTMYEDVFIKDTGAKETLKYATSGRADFDSKRDIIVLTEFPQVYQGEDTVTGDRIIVHRNTDVVEVENSNAFTEGETEKQ